MSSQALVVDGGAARGLALSPTAGALQQLRSFTSQPAFARSIPALLFLALAGIAVFVWMHVSAAPARDLFNGLADADKAAVVDALRGADISYEIDRDTGAIQVPDDEYHKARMLLAA